MLALLTRLWPPSSAGIVSAGSAAAAAAAAAVPAGAQKATFAAGCFWGPEHMFREEFGGRGLYDARVGYIGGGAERPSYRAVCSGRTGHAEAVQLEFDPARISYRQLLDFFYRMHDPTTAGAQGGDVGSQYRSAIFHHTAEQEREAREVTNLVNAQWFGGRVTTELLPAGSWWEAEAYHQRHLDVNPGGYHCSAHFKRAFPPLSS